MCVVHRTAGDRQKFHRQVDCGVFVAGKGIVAGECDVGRVATEGQVSEALLCLPPFDLVFP